jgi:protein TonB
MQAKTVCFTLLAGALLAAAKPATAEVSPAVRQAFARAVYEASPDLVHNRNPQPLLRAVVVLNLKLDESDHWQAEVVRFNDNQPEMLTRAIETVKRLPASASMDPAMRDEVRRNGFMEAWLFDNDGKFQVKTLAKAQLRGY